MRLPAVALAVLFACGVVLGQASWAAERVSSCGFLFIGFASVGVLICAGVILARVGRLFPAAAVSRISCFVACPEAAATQASVRAQPPDQQEHSKK